MKITKPALLALLLSLAGCISGQPPVDTYTSPTTGKTTVIQSDKEMCEQSCNDDYNRCMDAEPAGETLPGTHPGMFGPASECRSELSSCLPSCSTR
jgi:hypothetical protein